MNFIKHVIYDTQTLRNCLMQLNSMPDNSTLTLFVLNEKEQVVGTVTDGDTRRGFLDGKTIESLVTEVMHVDFHFLEYNRFNIEDVKALKQKGIQLVPILDSERKLVNILDFSKKRSLLPIDVVIMAGGEGKRLKPLTDNLPKPLLKVGNKPIIEHNVDRLRDFGVKHIHISVNYLAEKIKDYFQDGSSKELNIKYIKENKPLGTMGALGLSNEFENKFILVMNSDLLTTIDYEDFFISFLKSNADMAVATTPYKIKVPYAIVETEEDHITAFKEKPTYSYFSNAGIYLLKREILEQIPKNEFFNATDLMEILIGNGAKIISYPILGYWLDIGKPEDFQKAQEDIKHLKL